VGAVPVASAAWRLVFSCAQRMLRADTKFVAHFILASSDRLDGGFWVISLMRVSGVVDVGTDLGTSVCFWVGMVVVVPLAL
jgi:hypothetical protein